MQEQILDFLKKKSGYVSGDQLSHQLGITRQGLWKHIQTLKELGYDIVAVPHLGYKIISCPDKLFSEQISYQLKTNFMGKKIFYFDAVSSTMDVGLELGIKGMPEGTLVVAETQTKGRGRLGRHWSSPKHKGIYLSLIFRPKISPGEAPMLTLLAAVSICEAIKEIATLEAKIKWPNDILFHNKKLGGILTELSAEMDEVKFIVIGIGLNVNNDSKSLTEGATSIREQKKESLNRVELLQEILRRIEENYLIFQKKGSGIIIDKWRIHNITLGRRVRISAHKEHLEGDAVDIDSDGGLLVRNDSGLTQKVMAGDVVHCR